MKYQGDIKYKWGPFAMVGGDAQAVGEHLEALTQENGGKLTPAIVLKDAAKKGSLIHVYFEWKDSVAAYEYRLNQARELVRKIVVRIEKSPEAPLVRAFVKIDEDDGGYYTSIHAALSDDDMRLQVLARALKEAQDWRRRYKDLKEFDAVFQAIGEVSV